MKDRNGVPFQVGDVCVVHPVNNYHDSILAYTLGHNVVVVELKSTCRFSVKCMYNLCEDDWCPYFPHELEIIGDVR